MGVFLDIGEYDFYGRFDFSDDSDFLPTILAEEFSQEEIPKYFAKFNESEPSISSEKPDFFRETESVLSAGSPAGIAAFFSSSNEFRIKRVMNEILQHPEWVSTRIQKEVAAEFGVCPYTVFRALRRAKQINPDLPARWGKGINKTQRVVNAILAKGTITYLIN